jgi:hypothetical protein
MIRKEAKSRFEINACNEKKLSKEYCNAIFKQKFVVNTLKSYIYFSRCFSTLVFIVDTLADSYILKTSEVSDFAAEVACKRKHSKYSSIISSNYVFKDLAFETLGPWCKEAIDFINVIRNRLIAE